jgi:hypothetical protein
MTGLKVGGAVLVAIWICQAIVFLVSYHRQRRSV